MKISKNTTEILKNFSQIQTGINIKANEDYLVSVSESGSILANAKIDESFPVDVSIYDIMQFLSCLSLFKDPTLEFEDKFVKISETNGTASTIYHFGNSDLITSSPDDEFEIDDFFVELNLKNEVFQTVMKSSNVMGLNNIRIVGQNGRIVLEAYDAEQITKNVFDVELESDYTGGDFSAQFLVSSLIILKDDYKIGLVNLNGILASEFTGSGDKPTRYWIALEPSSTIPEVGQSDVRDSIEIDEHEELAQDEFDEFDL